MRRRERFEDSPHWTHTERVYGGAALTSLDVRRAVEAAAARARQRGWAVEGASWLRTHWIFRPVRVLWVLAGLGRARPNADARHARGQDLAGRT